jgi:hypothetical protein
VKHFRWHVFFSVLLLACASIVWGARLPLAELQATAANAIAGPRVVPARVLPVPHQDVSDRLQSLIRAPYPAFSKPVDHESSKALARLRETLAVSVADGHFLRKSLARDAGQAGAGEP